MVKHFKTIAVILSVSLFSRSAYANGVAVIDAATQSYFRLDSSVVTTSVENEIAITTIRNVFTNTVGHDTTIVLAYPSNYLASSTNIRWSIDAGWQNAQIISQAPSDTLPRSGPTDSTLTGYLGYAPFIFSVPGTIPKDSSLTVEYSYVELLLYSSGVMLYTCHNNYVSIQGTPLAYQGLTFEMVTQSTIDTLVFFGSQTVDWLSFTDHAATVMTSIDSSLANEDYLVAFSISLETTGVFDYSTFMDAVNVPDEYRGFFLLKVLPFYDSVLGAIPKNFILMIDRSGSMSDDSKMEDIKLASMNIISNLNVGDHFNIVEFSDGPGSFRPGLVPFTETTRDAALAFINNLDARGGTNISGAFEHVLPMYADADSASANLIMFLSDGEPTSGITDTPGLLADINQLVQVLDDTICRRDFSIMSQIRI